MCNTKRDEYYYVNPSVLFIKINNYFQQLMECLNKHNIQASIKYTSIVIRLIGSNTKPA